METCSGELRGRVERSGEAAGTDIIEYRISGIRARRGDEPAMCRLWLAVNGAPLFDNSVFGEDALQAVELGLQLVRKLGRLEFSSEPDAS